MIDPLTSLIARRVNAQQRLRQHHTDLQRLMRRVGALEANSGTPPVVGTAEDEYGGHNWFHWLSPDQPMHKGIEVTGKVFEWDKDSQTWTATGKQYVIRTDFWHGYAFAKQPVVGLFSHQPGKMYAVGSGYTYLIAKCLVDVLANNTATVELQNLPVWWPYDRFLDVRTTFGKIYASKLLGLTWNELTSVWDVTVSQC